MTNIPAPTLRIAVIGHVEHATIGTAPRLPDPGTIVHLDETEWIPGGGGGIAFYQLSRGSAELHFFTALGYDDAADAIEERLAQTGAQIHAARRDAPHTRDLIIVTPDGERTIFVVGEPLHPRRDDALPWDTLASCDAAYFTGQDPATVEAARSAQLLVITARRAESLARSGVRADVVIGSTRDPREASTLADYAVPPGALVMTEGEDGGRIETEQGTERFPPGTPPDKIVASYGAGDSFAGALTWYLARGLPLVEACTRASQHGADVLAAANPLTVQSSLS